MVKNLEDMQNFSKESVEMALKSFDAYAKNVQSIAQELSDYSKKSVDEGAKTMEKLFGAKSVDNAIEIQNAYLKSAYEGFVSQATKLSSLYVDMARETYKPFEMAIAKATDGRVTACATGLGVATALQSSSATVLLVVAFAERGLIALAPALAVMLGADIGSTIVVQALSLKSAALAPALLGQLPQIDRAP